MFRIGIALRPSYAVRGLQIILLPGVDNPERSLAKLERALELLSAHHPTRFRRVTQGVRRIGLVAGGGETYDHTLSCYFANVSLLERRTVTDVVLALVHESTHAMIRRRGVRTSSDNQARIERICVMEEVNVGKQLGLSNDDLRRVADRLESPWWGEEETRKRTAEFLRSLGLPGRRIGGDGK